MRQDLLQRPGVNTVRGLDLPLADSFNKHLASDICPHLHVCVKPS